MDAPRDTQARYPGYVLVVDSDDETLADSLSALADRGLDAVPAQTIEQIREIATARGRPFAVVIEPANKRLDGFRLCRSLRSSYDRTPPLIALASHKIHGRVAESRAFDAGADLFIERPSGDDELLSAIDRAAAGTTGAAGGASTGGHDLDRLRDLEPSRVSSRSGGSAAESGRRIATDAAAAVTNEATLATTIAIDGEQRASETIDLTEASADEFESWLDQAFSGFESPQGQAAVADEPSPAPVPSPGPLSGSDEGETVARAAESMDPPEASGGHELGLIGDGANVTAMTASHGAPGTVPPCADEAARASDPGIERAAAAAAALSGEIHPTASTPGDDGRVATISATPAAVPPPPRTGPEAGPGQAPEESKPAPEAPDPGASMPPAALEPRSQVIGHSRGRRRVWPLLAAALAGGAVVGVGLWLIGIPGATDIRATDSVTAMTARSSAPELEPDETPRAGALEDVPDAAPSVPLQGSVSASDDETRGVSTRDRTAAQAGLASAADDGSTRVADAAEPPRQPSPAAARPAPRPAAAPRGAPGGGSESASAREMTPVPPIVDATASEPPAINDGAVGADAADLASAGEPDLAAASAAGLAPTPTARPPASEQTGGSIAAGSDATEELAIVADSAAAQQPGDTATTSPGQETRRTLRPAEADSPLSSPPSPLAGQPGAEDRADASRAQAVPPAAADSAKPDAGEAPESDSAVGKAAAAAVIGLPGRASSVITAPELIRSTRVEPRYPLAARRLRAAGDVKLRVLVGADGRVTETEILEEPSSALGFGKAAADAVLLWRFRPALRDGKPVSQSTIVRFAFEP